MRWPTSPTAGSSTTASPTRPCDRAGGATRCGADKIGPIVSRGVLLDVAAGHGRRAPRARLRDHRRRPRRRRSSRPRSRCVPGDVALRAHRPDAAAPRRRHARATTTTRPGLSTAHDRWVRRPRPRRRVHRHLRLRGVAAAGLGGDDGRAHDPPARHGPAPGPELRPRGAWPPTAPPTASTSSSSPPTRSRSPAAAAPRCARWPPSSQHRRSAPRLTWPGLAGVRSSCRDKDSGFSSARERR